MKKLFRSGGSLLLSLALLAACVTLALAARVLPRSAAFTAETPADATDPALPACALTGEHVYTEFVPAAPGTHTAVCTLCGEPATLDCAYEEAVTPPTATEAGFTAHVCKKCGYRYEDAVTPAETGRAQSAMLGDVDLSGDVTAGDARAILRACVSLEPLTARALVYGDVDGSGDITAADARAALRLSVGLDMPALRHEYAVTVTASPTCTAAGSLSFSCAYCGKTGNMTLPANGHSFKTVSETAATCVKPGKRVRTCTVCGFTETVDFTAKNHSWKLDTVYKTAACSRCGAKPNGWLTLNGKTYYCSNGALYYSWCEIGGSYYFFDRSACTLVKGAKVDGLTVGADGKAATDWYTTGKIRTFIKAKNVVAQITKPTDSVDSKKLACFKWVMSFPYAQYRLVGQSMKSPGFEMLFANDIFDRHAGCCGSTSYAFAFLAVECGCKAVYVCDDGVSTSGHAWVTMEGNNRVYDVIFAEAKSFSANYDCAVSDYRRNPPRKTYIGG